jgi:hypothetical protein
VTSPERQGCAECQGVRIAGWRAPWWSIAAGSLAVITGASVIADALGSWQSPIPASMARRMHLLMQGNLSGFERPLSSRRDEAPPRQQPWRRSFPVAGGRRLFATALLKGPFRTG